MVVAGCSNREEPEVPEVPGETTSGGASDADDTPGTPEPSSTVGVPELCSDLIATARVLQILEIPIQGDTTRVFNDDFLADSGRTGRLTCSYGVVAPPTGVAPPPTPAPVPLEIAVSSYVDAEIAAGRIESTVSSTQDAGGAAQAQPVSGRDGFVLTDAEDISIVFADDVRTYVITLRRGVVVPAAEPVVLLGLAEEILGVESTTAPPSTSSPSATPPASTPSNTALPPT